MTSLPRYEKVSTLPPEEETDDTNSSPSSPTNPTSLNSYSSHTTYPISSHANDYTPVPTTHHTLLSTTHTPSSLPSSTSTTTSTSSSSSSSSSKQPLQNIHDGVFSNLSAKPTTVRSSTLNTASSSSSSSPSKDLPPSYDSVASDPAPLYPDTVVFTTATLDSDDEVLVDGLPVGSMVTFFLTMLVSMSFQFVGFCLTYLLSMTHAGRSGAKAGFGASLIQFGLNLRARTVHYPDSNSSVDDDDFGPFIPPNATPEEVEIILTRTQWISYLLILVGWLFILKSSLTYLRAKRLEALILATPESMIA